MSTKHTCAEFTYGKDFGAEIIPDPAVYPMSALESGELEEAQRWPAKDRLSDEDAADWDYIAVHGYESCEGITSGHVYKLVPGGFIIGDVLLTW